MRSDLKVNLVVTRSLLPWACIASMPRGSSPGPGARIPRRSAESYTDFCWQSWRPPFLHDFPMCYSIGCLPILPPIKDLQSQPRSAKNLSAGSLDFIVVDHILRSICGWFFRLNSDSQIDRNRKHLSVYVLVIVNVKIK